MEDGERVEIALVLGAHGGGIGLHGVGVHAGPRIQDRRVSRRSRASAIGRKLVELRAAEAELRATRRYLEAALACACESPERCGWIRAGARGARGARIAPSRA